MTNHSGDTIRANRKRVLHNQVLRLDRRLAGLYALSARYAQIRLAAFVGGLLLSAASFYLAGPGVGLLVSLLAIVAFTMTVIIHRWVERSILRHQIWRQLKAAHLARMTLDWESIPQESTQRASAKHPFARDLDLLGPRSLHRLLDTAVSREGSERLMRWLLDTEPVLADIQRRQKLVQTLEPLTYFRDKLSLNGSLAATGSAGWWQGQRLQKWLDTQSAASTLRPVLIIALILALLNIGLFILNRLGLLANFWIFSLIFYIGLNLFAAREVAGVFDSALVLQNGLNRLKAVFHHLETFPLQRYAPLKTLCAPFQNPESRPSAKLTYLARLVAAVGLVQNPAIAIALNLFIPWNLYFAHRLNRYKTEIAKSLPVWLEVWFELEALSSLATFAHLNPEYVFPELIAGGATRHNGSGQPLFEARHLGHPLIPLEERVSNDFSIAVLGEVGIITGSNMAGKSSFLRTIGSNVRLAYVGGPVSAVYFQAALFRLFTAISVSDSVTDGISYFYAEVKRLKALLEALEQPNQLPLLFLIDEIFRGTNNRERFIGSRSYIRALAGQPGLGLVATHDLELVKLADELGQIKNYHFRESITGNRMVFDYQLRPGPCPTTNALTIMQMEGLPVDDKNEA